MTAEETINVVAARLGITMRSEFVPCSLSRNAGEKRATLNWKVTLYRNERPILTTDYSAGSAHCPSYKQRCSADDARAILWECENGQKARLLASIDHITGGLPILPKLADVLHSLASDADVIDCGSFEEWAENLGYDTDSRKAEAIYRACLEIGLKLRNALGEDGLRQLREACQDY